MPHFSSFFFVRSKICTKFSFVKVVTSAIFFFTSLLGLSAQNTVYAPLFTTSSFTKTIDLNRPVGTVQAAADASSGNAIYSIPIVIPPGTNGVAPSISITYSSLAGNGVVGRGWNISGLSMITRIGQSIYHNGGIKPVQLSTEDRFALDGTRLISKTGTYGASGATYGKELEDFATITSNGLFGGGPQWFSVVTKEGVTMEYGNSTDSRFLNSNNTVVLFWRLNKIIYNDGNYIEFKYTNVDFDSRIDEINYTGNAAAGLTPYNKLKFTYTIRNDINTAYEANASVVSKYLLDQITVTAEGAAAFKTYKFNYAFNNTSSFLREVTESGSSGSSLNSTIFKYGDIPTSFASESSSAIAGSQVDIFNGDFNADGYSDMMVCTRDLVNIGQHTDFKVYLKDANPSNNTFIYPSATGIIALDAGSTVVNKKDVPNLYNFLTGDFTGDGAEDILTFKTTGSGSNRTLLNIRTYESKNNGTNFNTYYDRLPQVNFTKINPNGNFIYPGDFDGDGKSDYITLLGNVLGNYDAFLCLGTSGGCSSISISGSASFPTSGWVLSDKINVVDFNGDGKSDLMLIQNNTCEIFTFEGTTAKRIYSSGFPTKWHLLFFGDFNGDGKTDILCRTSTTDNNAPWYKDMSTGTGFVETPFTFSHTPIINQAYYGDKIIISDYNGDGKMDIANAWNYWVTPTQQASKTDMYYSRGDNFYSEQYNSSQTFVSSPTVFPFDSNGDGRSEIMNRGLYTQPFDILFYYKAGKDLLLHKVKNGVDHTTEWTYKRMTEAGTFYTRGNLTSYPLNNIQIPMNLVFELNAQDGIGGNMTKQFSYEEAKLHKAGKGFLGFKKVTANDLDFGQKSIVESEFNTTFYIAAPFRLSSYLTSTNTLLRQTDLSNQFEEQGTGTKRVWVKTTYSYEVKSFEQTFTANDITYDAYGNVTQNITYTGGTETTTTTSVYGTYGTPIPAKPTSITVSNIRNGGPPAYAVTTTMSYNTIGQLTSKTNFSGQAQSVTTSYTYNNLGNQTGTTVTPSGMSARSMTSTYDSKGRYPLSTTNTLGQTATATFDPKWGKPLSETGIDGITTSFNYDQFGRLQTTIMPQGWIVTEAYAWDINTTDGTIHYHLTTHPGKPDLKVWYDLLDREKKTQIEGFQNQWITKKVTYDARGNIYTTTTPYKSGETILTNTNVYDDYNRLISTSNSIGSSTISYAYNTGGLLTTTTTNPAGQVSSRITDATGKLTSATDYGGTLTYAYNSQGNATQVNQGATQLVLNEFDAYGRQTKLTDINAGVTQYTYDALGQMITQTSALNQTTTTSYDLLGRVTQRVGPEGTTTNEYFPSGSGTATNKIKKITGFAGELQEYTFDTYGRINTEKTTVDGTAHTTTYGYDTYSRTTSVAYPSGFTLNSAYDANGYLNTLKNGNNTITIFTNSGMNGFNQLTAYTLGNGLSSANTYYFGVPTRYLTTGIQDLNLSWNYQSGNLNSRNDAIKGKTESFTYDNLNRLLTSSGTGLSTITMSYASTGNISSKTDAGNYTYGISKLNAVTSVTNPSSNIPTLTQNITYTPYFQPATISEGTNVLTYTYGSDYQRIKGVLTQSGSVVNTRYYFAGYEKDITGSSTKYIHYINAGQGVVAMVVRENGADSYYYTYTDHIGSLLTLTNSAGTVQAEQNFDAWGRKRNTSTWAYTGVQSIPSWLYRGFTGHEHLPQFTLINMNGRIYDPLVGRMLSPDNHIQTPDYTQNYNRYSYALNNPLRFTDPNGEVVIAPIIAGAIIGACLNVAIQGARGNIVNGDRDFYRAFGLGALQGALIGLGASTIPSAVLNVAGASASSLLPSFQVPVGENLTLSLSPALVFGTGVGVGLNFGATIHSEYGSIGFSYGLTGYLKHYASGKRFVERRFSYGATLGGEDFYLSIGSNNFKGGGLSQRTGFGGVGGNGWSVSYENDGTPWNNVGNGDGGDSYRTAAVTIRYKQYSLGMNIFTGCRDYKNEIPPEPGYPNGRVGNPEINDYKFGGLFVGSGNYRVGWNHYMIGQTFQNLTAHNIISKQAYIPWMDHTSYYPNSYYGGYFTRNPFTNW